MTFLTDIFSSATPVWFPVASSKYFQLSQVLLHYLPDHEITEIHQIGAIEINSNNYRVSFADGSRFFLKRSYSQIDAHKRSFLAQQYLYRRDCPVLIPIPTLSGEPCILLNHNVYSLYPYVEGSYFSGELSHLHSVASSIGRLFALLKDFPHSRSFPQHLQLFTDVNANLVGRLYHLLGALTPTGSESFSFYT